MELFTVTLTTNDTLLSIPLNHLQGIGQSTQSNQGYVVVGGQKTYTKEDYLTLMDMWNSFKN